eukprot:7797570-Pyramimonas_sp.AAC.1
MFPDTTCPCQALVGYGRVKTPRGPCTDHRCELTTPTHFKTLNGRPGGARSPVRIQAVFTRIYSCLLAFTR